MRRFKKSVSVALSAAMVVSLVGCAKSETGDVAATVTEENTEAVTEETTQEVAKGQQTSTVIQESSESNASEEAIAELLSTYEQDSESLVFDSSAWNYDAENDVYWQIGVGYCSNPETTDYETMGIYVPGAYMTGVENGDGTYTCTMNTEGEVAGYTAETAPIVFPVNTAGYSAQAAPTAYSYNSISQYLESGFIYVYAGMRGGMGMNNSDSSDSSGTTYETAKDYIDSLNADGEWITYDEATNTASITSIADFVTHCKSASKNVGAFDDLDRGQAENMLFGNDESDALHFDPILASLLIQNEAEYSVYAEWDSSYAEAYESDLTSVDKFGNTIEERMNMYNPMYYLSDYYEGYETSNVATYWRIHTGITQGDTALTVEANLALALKQYEGVESVDFATVWGQGHTTAERTGDSTTNFIAWVNECVGQ